jgi:hypothetical protein
LPQNAARVRGENMPGIRRNHAAGLPLKKRLSDFGFQAPQLL